MPFLKISNLNLNRTNLFLSHRKAWNCILIILFNFIKTFNPYMYLVPYIVCHVYYHRLPYIQISAGGRSKKLRLQTVIKGHNLPYILVEPCPPPEPQTPPALQLDRFTRQAKPITCLCFLFRACLWTVWVATLEPIDLMLAWPRGCSNCHWRLLRLWRLLEKLLMLLLVGVHKQRWQDKISR